MGSLLISGFPGSQLTYLDLRQTAYVEIRALRDTV